MTSVVKNVWNAVVRVGAGKSAKDSDALDRQAVDGAIDEYNEMFNEDSKDKGQDKKKIGERKQKYKTMVNHYYDLVTDFYEYGWGESFHFAPRFTGETFAASIARHEHYLALRLELKAGMKVMDAGCGVGGPMRAIARFSGANVIGVNNNDYQIKRSNILNERNQLSHLCNTMKGDFMALPFEEGTFDCVYAIEATCHAPDKVGCFSQMYKVLKPGGLFAGYEWCMTDRYDASNEEHRRIKHVIEKGDSLPDLVHTSVVDDAVKKAGFELIEAFDVAEVAPKNGNQVGWHSTLKGSMINPSQFKHSKVGRWVTQQMVDVLETLHIAPKGTSKTHHMLSEAADALYLGGETGIFTPMYFFIGRKPLDAKKKASKAQ